MATTWLRTNTRVCCAALLPPAVLLLVCAYLILAGIADSPTWRGLSVVGFALAAIALAFIFWQMLRPRLACDGRELLVYLRLGKPLRVPLEVVECFLLGHGPSMLPGGHQNRQAATLVVRLAEKAETWHRRDTFRPLGSWCDGHIVINGVWCQPLTLDLVYQLNAHLAQAGEALRKTA